MGLNASDIDAMKARAWDRICEILDEVVPDWNTKFHKPTGTENAVAAIKYLAEQAKKGKSKCS